VRFLYRCREEEEWLLCLVVSIILGLVALIVLEVYWESANARNGIIAGFNLRAVEFEGHKYIKNLDGGIVHAQSCQCFTNATLRRVVTEAIR
jgi:hypothetical protein